MIQNLESAHFNMLEQQVRPSEVLDPRVLKALNDVARDQFVDEDLLGLAYADTSLPVGYGQTMLSPVIQGRLLQAIDVQSDEEVLEIGTGNGYFTALLAQLAKHVTSVDIVPELSESAQQHLTNAGIDNVTLRVGDASRAWELPDRIDVIIVTAAFVSVPDAYLQSLSVGGRMLAVVGEGDVMTVQIIHRITEWEWQTESVFETVIPAMINAEPKPEFEF
jgi:protein-L-isoaspartate(D-aspartate) O-methyltransferase